MNNLERTVIKVIEGTKVTENDMWEFANVLKDLHFFAKGIIYYDDRVSSGAKKVAELTNIDLKKFDLLDEVIKESQGIEVKEEIDIQIDLNVTSYIPDDYIKDSSQKIEIYQNIALCKNEEDIQNVIDEIIDRYGNMPKELENLLSIARIKYLAKDLQIIKINQRQENIVFTFEGGENKYDIVKLIEIYKEKIKFSPGIKTMITLKIKEIEEQKILNSVTEFLKELKNLERNDII